MINFRLLFWLPVLLLLSGPDIIAQTTGGTASDSDTYQINAYKLAQNEGIELDGKLNESFWTKIRPVNNFRQQEPNEGGAPSQRTEIFVAFDDTYLYIGAKLFDREPSRILAYQKRKDRSLGTDDRFMWILDTFNDGRNAYFFETNPAALRGDGLLTVGQGTNLNKSWDGIWNVQTSITAQGWIAEIRIPFRSLDFDPENTRWGINFQRTVRRNNEEIVWAGWRRNQGLFRPQNAGTLQGLSGMSQGLGLEVNPYVTTTGNRRWTDGVSSDAGTFDTGFDAAYSITPSVRASLTINTDFAETEVDQRRVNLTRFPLRFPEQRNFFLEGATIFNFAPSSGVEPFFSRRIGLEDGESIPLNAGIRLLGREGNTNMGFYQIRTGAKGEINREDFTAARVSQNLFSESKVGLIYTRRATLDEAAVDDRHTLGADMDFGTSSFLGDKNFQFQAFFVWHNQNGPLEKSSFWDRTSRGIRINYPNFPFSGSMSYREFGESFNPAVGFTQRNGFRRLQPTIEYEKIVRNSSVIRSWETGLRYEYLTNLDFEPETINIRYTPFDIEFESGDEVEMSLSRDFERLTTNFDILRDGRVIIPPGDYYSWSLNAEVETASFRKISGGAEVTLQGFWTGNRNGYQFFGTLRPFPGINLTADWNRSDVSLPGVNFVTNLIRFRGDADFTPNTAFTNIIQYDDVSGVLGLFSRFRWTITPGSDLFLVYTHNWIEVEKNFEPIEIQGAAKINYTHRF